MKRILMAMVTLLLSVTPAMAETNILFIVDASGSMKKKVGKETRMDAAKDVLGQTLSQMPESATLGLLTYGHRRGKDCTDIELISPLGQTGADGLQKTISSLEAKGETPIAASLQEAVKAFDGREKQYNKIILVTDGLEECKGDPCAAAQAVKDAGLDVAVDIVGFTLGEEEAKAVQCITETTGGQYYGAADASALTKALQKAAEPKKTLMSEYKFDSMKSIAANWTIQNEDDETYIFEKGALTLISNAKDPKVSPYIPNTFTYNNDLPEGDWAMRVTFKPERGKHTNFGFTFGDLENTEKVKHMFAGAASGVSTQVLGGFWLNSKGKKTEEHVRASNQYDDSWGGIATRIGTQERFEMEVSRIGREYILKIRGADVPNSDWLPLTKIGVLKPFKKIHLTLGKNANTPDASTFKVEKVSLYKVGK